MTQGNTSSGAGNISKFEITSNKGGGSKDISAGVVDYKYYESVLSNNITATAVVLETGNDESGAAPGVLDSLPIRGGEKTTIQVEDARGNQLQVPPLYVNRVRNADPQTQQDLYILDFASREHFMNNQSRVTERYEGKISDNVSKIVQEKLGTQLKEVDNTQYELNFIGNSRKAFYTCTWLAARAVPEGSQDKVGGFLFFQTREGYFFKAIDKIFEKSATKKFIYNNTGFLPPEYDSIIIDYKIGSDIDMKRNLDIGAYNTNSIYFDFASMSYKEVKFDIQEQEGAAKTAGKDYIVVNEEFIKEPSRWFNRIKDIGVNPKGTGDQQLDGWQEGNEVKTNYKDEESTVQIIMRFNQMFTVQTEILIPGDFSIKAGDIVECDFSQLESTKNKENNPQSGGVYMVAHVCHRVSPTESLTSLGLVRDSFGKKGGF